MVKLPSFIHGIIIGVLLSDGWVRLQQKNRSINGCLHFKQSVAHSQYVCLYLTYCLTIVLVSLF